MHCELGRTPKLPVCSNETSTLCRLLHRSNSVVFALRDYVPMHTRCSARFYEEDPVNQPDEVARSLTIGQQVG